MPSITTRNEAYFANSDTTTIMDHLLHNKLFNKVTLESFSAQYRTIATNKLNILEGRFAFLILS